MDARPLAVITGGSSGIGLALARRLALRQWRLALVARGVERLEAAAISLPVETSVHVCDVGDPDAVRGLAAELLELGGGRIDLLACNAGIPGRSGALDVDPAVARQVMDVNYHGMVGLTRALWPGLVTARGRVVNVCSVAGTVALARSAPYAASKHAALAWSRALAAVAPTEGVRVLTVNPGPVTTAGFPQSKLLAHPIGRRLVVSDEACASAIIRGLENRRREIFVPQWWRLAGVAQAIAPVTMARLAARAG
jgi:dehydrogenase/reductase SDR family protein 7B